MTDLPDTLSDRYQIKGLLGSGGMAKVYKAYDERLSRNVAIKIVAIETFIQPKDRQKYITRFNKEISVLKKLSHPNIMNILDFGEFEGKPYFISEYLQGGTLREKMEKPIPWKEAVRGLLPVARGLMYAHQNGIIHRDIKPENILIRESGEPVLSDFGIAKSLDGIGINKTVTGEIWGTPEYMAPEQMNNAKDIDIQADVFSLGVVLYEMITGHRPYKINYDLGIPKLDSKDYVDPQEYVSNLPEQVQFVLFKALSLKPKSRIRDMDEFLRILDNLLIDPVNKVSFLLPQKPMNKPQRTAIIVARYTLYGAVIAATCGFFGLLFPAILGAPWAQELLTRAISPVQSPVNESLLLPTAVNTTNPFETPTNDVSPNVDLPIEIISPLRTIMRLVPAGEFKIGSNANEAYVECQKHRPDCIQSRFADEESSPQILYLNAYYIDQYEVTNAFYKLCVDAKVCLPPQDNRSQTRISYYGNQEFDNYPVIYVDWNMAKTFCEWSGGRLPTEAEWEKAARGADGRTYPWGEDLDCTHANFGQGTDGTCVGDTTPVGSYEIGQSIYGLYDMAGNVNEWVSSLYKPYPYSVDDGREILDVFGVRVFRGGSWDYSTGDVRTTNRNGLGPASASDNIGFRCAWDVP
ncbi:MAG: SUMF1/EgtB/PvdO family nonheme iron enzyme [Anaerolineales bacterium]|nr:SUMF1/EgtB/PvdO family nonheme iron enzyme [Anaerolineales bacterium]